VTGSYRVAPAFDLDLTKVLILREAQSPQSFGPYSTTSGSSAYLTVSVGSQYANGFSVTTNGSTSISGKKLTGDTATGEYTLQYKSAASGGTVCAILYDGSKVKYYGSLGTASSTSGSVTMDLGSISAGTYTMAVYEEDTANGYASTPVICKLVVTSEDAAKEDNTVTAPEGFTSSEEGASNIPSASNRIDALDTTGTTTYHLGNNGWYGVTDETGTWELVDTDGKFGSTNSASVWGTDYSGQTILDYTNGLADTNLASLKSAGVLQTKDVDTKDVGTSGTGSLTGAYMWPLSKTQLDGNTTLAGKLYTSTGTSVWTRSFNDYIAGSMRYDAWLVTDNKGTLTSTSAWMFPRSWYPVRPHPPRALLPMTGQVPTWWQMWAASMQTVLLLPMTEQTR
jgi:hypothetical protein